MHVGDDLVMKEDFMGLSVLQNTTSKTIYCNSGVTEAKYSIKLL